MGSWFGTDALTQLAIRDGDKARLFFLTPRKGYRGDVIGGGFSYPDDTYAPVGVPVLGRYNDYGVIARIEDGIESEFMTDWLVNGLAKKEIVLTKESEAKKDDLAKPTLEAFITWVERGWVRLQPWNRGDEPLTFMLVLESVYAAAMEEGTKLGECCWDSKPCKPIIEERVAAYLKFLERPQPKPEVTTDADREAYLDERSTTREALWQFEHANFVLRFDFEDYARRKGVNAAAKDMIVNHFVFKKFMERSRKHFAPQSGAGMQDDAFALQGALAKATLAVCAKRGKERD